MLSTISLVQDRAAARTRFRLDGYLPLPGLLTDDGLAALRDEAQRLEMAATRRDFTMACMDDSPRHMTTLGGHVIAEESSMITTLYAASELRTLIETLTGGAVTDVPDPVERHVLNILHREGDTHGAHTDDYPYALVLFLEAPDHPDLGGILEYVPQARSFDGIDDVTAVRTAHHRAGDGYLLRSDTTAHRVTPLTRSGLRRVVLNFAYGTSAAPARTTTSARELYT
ncbi:HalD/BesD family halogenase [Streptomyces sp. NPDC001009]